MSIGQEKRFALLIDADNIGSKYIKVIIDELTNSGVITIKRIYGDWTKPAMDNWKKILLEYSITPMQQYAYTSGKNSTDSAMIIDAMDILYSNKVDGFCLASSDSDFTRLAVRLREAGMEVIGMGEHKTVRPFVTACSQFKYIDLLDKTNDKNEQTLTNNSSSKAKIVNQVETAKIEDAETEAKDEVSSNASSGKTEEQCVVVKPEESGLRSEGESSPTSIDEIKSYLESLIDQKSDNEGWMLLSNVGFMLSKKFPDFDSRNYGHKKLNTLLDSWGFELESIKDPNNKEIPDATINYIRIKRV